MLFTQSQSSLSLVLPLKPALESSSAETNLLLLDLPNSSSARACALRQPGFEPGRQQHWFYVKYFHFIPALCACLASTLCSTKAPINKSFSIKDEIIVSYVMIPSKKVTKKVLFHFFLI